MVDYKFFFQTFVDTCRLLAKYNTMSNELFVVRDEKGRPGNYEEPVDADEFLTAILDSGVVYEKDKQQLERLMDRKYVRAYSETHQSGSLAIYRRLCQGKQIWTRLNLFVPKEYSKENPFVVLFNRDMPEEEAILFEAMAYSCEEAYKVLRINLTTDTFIPLKLFSNEEKKKQTNTEYIFSKEVDEVRAEYVHPNDVPSYDKYLDPDYIRRYFREGQSDYRFFYRRKVKGTYRWVRLRIVPAAEYSGENEVLYCYVIDDHKAILKFLDAQAASAYGKIFAKEEEPFSVGYHEHLLDILSVLTEPYIDFYLVDLDRDIYINYKLGDILVNRDIPSVGDYSLITEHYLSMNYSKEDREILNKYSTSAKLKELLMDRMTIEYSYTYPNGMRVKTTCLKIESKNGIPVKVLCYALPEEESGKLVLRTFGNFEVLNPDGTPVKFSRKQSKHLLAYLVDRQGFPATSKDIVRDVLEKDPQDLKAIKYVSTMIRRLIKELEAAGYYNVVIKEPKSVRINTNAVDCDYYHFLEGNATYWQRYHNEYMKEYSWAEETNAELLSITDI